MTDNEVTEGYIYCFSTPSMPDYVKIGMTKRTPEDRLKEANAPDTWRPQIQYKIEFAKKVPDALGKEKALHKLLEEQRIEDGREFFRISPEYARKLFDLIDGEIWNETAVVEERERARQEKQRMKDEQRERQQQEKLLERARKAEEKAKEKERQKLEPIIKQFNEFKTARIRYDSDSETTINDLWRSFRNWHCEYNKIGQLITQEKFEELLKVEFGEPIINSSTSRKAYKGIRSFMCEEEVDEYDEAKHSE